MPATYEPIATTTLGSAAASIDFTSISSAYTDLKIILTTTSSVNGADLYMRFNSDSATNYSITYLRGNGTSAATSRLSSQTQMTLTSGVVGLSSTIPQFYSIDIFSYTDSAFKTALTNTNGDRNGTGGVSDVVSLWRSTSAITSVNLLPSGGNFNANTSATLYGILKA